MSTEMASGWQRKAVFCCGRNEASISGSISENAVQKTAASRLFPRLSRSSCSEQQSTLQRMKSSILCHKLKQSRSLAVPLSRYRARVVWGWKHQVFKPHLCVLQQKYLHSLQVDTRNQTMPAEEDCAASRFLSAVLGYIS